MTIDRAIEILDPDHREHYDSLEEVNGACRMGMEALKRQRWIPCSERLPGTSQRVLFWPYRVSRCYVGYYSHTSRAGDVWFETDGDCVEHVTVYTASHWMPLPEPPEEGGNENAN